MFNLKKKGDLDVRTILEIGMVVAALIAVSTFILIAISFGSEETTVKTNIAKDMSLLINSLTDSPDDIIVYYPIDLSDYIISISSNTLILYQNELEPPNLRISEKLILPKDFTLKDSKITHQKLAHFKKTGTTIEVGFGPTEISNTIKTVSVNTKNENWPSLSIAIAPFAIEGEKNILGQEIVANINALSKKETSQLKDLVDITTADLVIEVKLVKENKATIYIPLTQDYLGKNKKLASLILNNLKQESIETSLLISEEKFFIKKSDISLVLEVSEELSYSKIADSIEKAIGDYYK